MTLSRMVLATRRSPLALAQARAFARDVVARFPGLVIEELLVVTTGDKVTNVPLSEVGGKGVFTKEIEDALDRGEADFAVHSFKDLPAELSPKFVIACVPRRADPRDALVSKSGAELSHLASGAKVGTSSLRRAVQLSLARPDLVLVPLRGNVDTRLRKLDRGELDGVVLARAGLERLGLASRITQTLDPNVMIPAPGQGALAIECRARDPEIRRLLDALSDRETEVAVACERGVMAAVGGNCNLPFGAYAARRGDELHLSTLLAAADGSAPRRLERAVPWPATSERADVVGREAGRALLDA